MDKIEIKNEGELMYIDNEVDLSMTAEEMFEELGYKKIEDSDPIIYSDGYTSITFANKEICIYDPIEAWLEVPVFKAINKQIKELGWK